MHPPILTLAVTVGGRWQPGIGDPTPLGWLTVTAYAAASVACYLASRRSRAARWWLSFAAVLAPLAVNKALDLQSWFTHAGRRLARDQGWYMSHGPAQVVAIAAVAVLALVLTASFSRLTRRRAGAAVRLAAIAVTYQVTFVIVRSISLHEIDRLLGVNAGPFRLNHVFECAGLAVVIAAAIGAMTTRRQASPERDEIALRASSGGA